MTRKKRLTAGTVLTMALLGALGLANARWAAADPGWKFYAPALGGCVIDCHPVPPEFSCPCYELPPIEVEG